MEILKIINDSKTYFMGSFAFYVSRDGVVMSNGSRQEIISRELTAKIFRINRKSVKLFA